MGPLQGLRVLDLTTGPGRSASQLLAGLGADVVRLRRGDPGPPLDDRGGLLDWWFDAGTRRAPVDLDTPQGKDRLRGLVAGADVLIEGEPPGTMAARASDRRSCRR